MVTRSSPQTPSRSCRNQILSLLRPAESPTMKPTGGPKLIVFHPSIHRQGGGSRVRLFGFVSFFTFASLLALLALREFPPSSRQPGHYSGRLPAGVIDALVHYASCNATPNMPLDDMKSVSNTLSQLAPCNFLVFGLGHETLLWKALNPGGRTVFLDESEFHIAQFEYKYRDIEAYEVQYTTTVNQMTQLLNSAKEQIGKRCRPVQNLLFSDCELGINDLPNQLYEVEWDLILIDGPGGYYPMAPGRMSAIFTAGVMARSKKGRRATHIFVHDIERNVETVFSEEFLCDENRILDNAGTGMAHFLVQPADTASLTFCHHRTIPSTPA